MPSVHLLQAAEPRPHAAPSAPARDGEPFSDILDGANARRRDAKTPADGAKHSEPQAPASRAKARSESLARGETPAAGPRDSERKDAGAEQQAVNDAEGGGDGETAAIAEDAGETAAPDGPDVKADGASAHLEGVAGVDTESKEAADEGSKQPDSSAGQPTAEPAGGEAEVADATAPPEDGDGESVGPNEISVASHGTGAAEAADSESAVPTAAVENKVAAPAAATVARAAAAKASATAQSGDADLPGVVAPQPSHGRAVGPVGDVPQVLQAQPTNPAGVTAGNADANAGGDPDARLPQPQGNTQPVQGRPPEFAAPRPAEPAHAPLPASDASPARAQPNPVIPVIAGSEPARALAASFQPVSLQAAHANVPNAVPANGAALAVEIVSRMREGTRRFDIRLDPPELGRVDVRLEVDRHGHATTRLTVDRPETLDVLQREARTLERALHSAGLKTDEGGLEFSLRQQTNDGPADGRRESGEPRGELLVSDDERAEAVNEGYRSAAFARGGIDIRI